MAYPCFISFLTSQYFSSCFYMSCSLFLSITSELTNHSRYYSLPNYTFTYIHISTWITSGLPRVFDSVSMLNMVTKVYLSENQLITSCSENMQQLLNPLIGLVLIYRHVIDNLLLIFMFTWNIWDFLVVKLLYMVRWYLSYRLGEMTCRSLSTNFMDIMGFF